MTRLAVEITPAWRWREEEKKKTKEKRKRAALDLFFFFFSLIGLNGGSRCVLSKAAAAKKK